MAHPITGQETLIGSGSYSNVYLSSYDEKEYAVKCPSTYINGIVSPLEIDILVRLDHPSLIKASFIHTLSSIKDYLQLWLPRGEKYSSLSIPKREIPRLCWEIATGVSFLHQQDILHLDLDLANIVKVNTLYKVIDFGLAQYCPSGERQNPGTVTILSSRPPEILHADLSLDGPYPLSKACDIWSLGLLFLRVATREYYFLRKETIQDQYNCFRRHLGNKEKARRCMKVWLADPDLINLLVKMLSWEPEDRPSIKQVLEHRYFQKYGFSLPLANVKSGLSLNPNLDINIREEITSLSSKIYSLTDELPFTTFIRGIDLYYRLASLKPDPHFMANLESRKLFLLSCLILALKLDAVPMYKVPRNLSYKEYTTTEKEIISLTNGHLWYPIRKTCSLLTLKEYCTSEEVNVLPPSPNLEDLA